MRPIQSEAVREIVALAGKHTREMNHDALGTQHLLLASVESGAAIEGASATAVRDAILRMTPCGESTAAVAATRLTPRARNVIARAQFYAIASRSKEMAIEHLLLALVGEPDGVASRIMDELGIDRQRISQRCMSVRVEQLAIVERIVRPVRAPMGTKRRMRDELLAHLESVYEEQLVAGDQPTTALALAAQRLGDPAALSRELNASLTSTERIGAAIEWIFGWHPPETARRFVARQALITLAIMVAVWGLGGVVAGTMHYGWNEALWLSMRPLVAAMVVFPPMQFLLGLAYYTMRDTFFAAFRARYSRRRIAMLAGLTALTFACGALGFFSIAEGSVTIALRNCMGVIAAAPMVTGICCLAAYRNGPQELSDSVYSLLPLSQPANG